MREFWEQGVIHSKTRCWAQGMDGWRPLQTVPQLKWTLMASGQAVMNESDLATLVLNMLIRMTEYYPSKSVLHYTHLHSCVCRHQMDFVNTLLAGRKKNLHGYHHF